MLPTALSDTDELLLSTFTPHSLLDGVSVCVLDGSLFVGISHHCQGWPLSSFLLHLSIQTLVILHFGTLSWSKENVPSWAFWSPSLLIVLSPSPSPLSLLRKPPHLG